MNNDLPKDPMLCLSVVNTKLRDYYKDIDILCQDLQIKKDDLFAKLQSIGYEYDTNTNQFV